MRWFVILVVCAAACSSGSSSSPAAGGGTGGSAAPRASDAPEVPIDDQSRFDQERQPERLIGLLGIKAGMTVADVGAGTGLLTVHVARAVFPGGHVVATDIDAAVLSYLGARMEAAGFDTVVEPRQVAATEPGLEPGRFDLILLAQVDHYFDDRVAWLTKAVPALKPDGRLAITNRMQHRAAVMAAAASVGLELVTEVNDLPGQFVALFARGPASGARPTPTKGAP
ncbi:MAG: class I SAM-dependent methyltransferase [Myxococcales bacterium]|nr:class I SAM-dependent methyltransferase [Myxococcales bacterium]